ncbi:similar to Saccharomyces cerevisiae YAL056W GPB2 Multistep regulator of cAMP-PKA signaling [Maudiozyma saulgeensis]|uniref:Similar to Saccharomyces cerevisiae YAL056W GPB2 Multistep regulator of cAMP-PKA signaling n=1 Tax=Maudiozyma saulgeensis TaxID=1789683 RepID=A0A1X7R7N1_9SACH|nr:similar to Saccharomyces cerevisiae YAL056W GPB2 Multistep regulator of cAMP-PKA signaling [Kazachstania saulgeensis]
MDARDILINNASMLDKYLTTDDRTGTSSNDSQAHPVLSVPVSAAFSLLSASANFENDFKTFNYISNYTSILSTTLDEFRSQNIKLNNELQLAKYYEYKKPITSNTIRQNSVVSTSDSSIIQSDRNKNINSIIDNFLSFAENNIDPYRLKDSLKKYDDIPNPHSGLRLSKLYNDTHLSDDAEKDSHSFSNLNFANPYYKYYKKLLTVDLKDYDILKKHNLWVPTVRKDHTQFLTEFKSGEKQDNDDIYKDKTCPLFITATYALPSLYDFHAGHSILPSIFSEFKLPSLVYHTTVEFNGQVFILGGLMACYRNDNEIPNVENYYVDGIKNLPPPLLQDVINNPTMVNNPYLYVHYVNSSRLSRPNISGQIPPPLLCMTATKLTDRYLLFYGGIEIKTETNFDPTGKVFIKKRAFLNNTAYILDTVSFKFTKIEVNTQSFKDGTSTTFTPRFGHMQIAIKSSDLDMSCSSGLRESSSSLAVSVSSSMKKDDSPNIDPQPDGNANGTTPSNSIPMVSSPSNATTNTTNSNANATNNSNSNNTSTSNTHHANNAFSILIYGGYRQTVDDKYTALDDMWRLDVNIVARGKKGYLKFADSIVASNIPVIGEEGEIPNARAFFAYCLPDTILQGKTSLENTLLKRLEEEFNVESNLFGNHNAGSNSNDPTTLLFPNIPHGSHIPIDKVTTNTSINTNASSRTATNNSRGGTNVSTGTPNSYNTATSTNLSKSISNNFNERQNERRSNTNESINSGSLHNQLRSMNSYSGKFDPSRNSDTKRVIVIHGGSNNLDVFGDMWWFDLDTMKWLKIDTYDKRNSNKEKVLEVSELKLVGHSMVSAGYTGIFIGGMDENSVKRIYYDESNCESQTTTTGNGLVNVINLMTQCLMEDNDDPVEFMYEGQEVDPNAFELLKKLRSVCSVGGSTIESEGTVLVIGGVVFNNSDTDKIYLRGAMLEFILPAMSLPI